MLCAFVKCMALQVNEPKILGLMEILFYKEALGNKQCTEQTN